MANYEMDIEQINRVFLKHNLKVTRVIEGTRINQYRIKLDIDSDVKKLLKLRDSLIIGLDDNTINVFQDKSELVIEKKVSDRVLKMSDVFYKSMYKRDKSFRLVLGTDMENHSVTTLLPKAPHILVSGCTGSGKTQLLHCFIASLLLGATAHNLILIDPKGSEFNIYKNIDTVKFVDNAADGIKALKWLVDEMNSRYQYMSRINANDVTDTDLTRIVCIIDEFADLIKTDKAIENYVVLIAQKARACGIHLIIGTQYPKSDVVTGLIQANIPTRICLKVLSNIQSRVAIDRVGGERLLGHGDMLYLGNGMYEPIHLQAPFISSEDKQAVVNKATADLKGLGPRSKQHEEAAKKVQPSPMPTPAPYVPKKPATYCDPSVPKKKHVGLLRGLKNILDAPQIVFTFHEDE